MARCLWINYTYASRGDASSTVQLIDLSAIKLFDLEDLIDHVFTLGYVDAKYRPASWWERPDGLQLGGCTPLEDLTKAGLGGCEDSALKLVIGDGPAYVWLTYVFKQPEQHCIRKKDQCPCTQAPQQQNHCGQAQQQLHHYQHPGAHAHANHHPHDQFYHGQDLYHHSHHVGQVHHYGHDQFNHGVHALQHGHAQSNHAQDHCLQSHHSAFTPSAHVAQRIKLRDVQTAGPCDVLAHLTDYVFARGFLPAPARSRVYWQAPCGRRVHEHERIEHIITSGAGCNGTRASSSWWTFVQNENKTMCSCAPCGAAPARVTASSGSTASVLTPFLVVPAVLVALAWQTVRR